MSARYPRSSDLGEISHLQRQAVDVYAHEPREGDELDGDSDARQVPVDLGKMCLYKDLSTRSVVSRTTAASLDSRRRAHLEHSLVGHGPDHRGDVIV